MNSAPATSRSRALSPEELQQFGAEIDALRARVQADLGERDAKYIRKVVKVQRWIEVTGRALLVAAGWFPPVWLIGTLMLGIAKILDNMEIGHNVIHGQYDWMGDPHLNGKTYEWDIVGTADNWRKTHNFRHHTYTNIHGMDDDVGGYGVLRLFPEQKWHPASLFQPIYAVIFALLFQWGVAIQDLRVGRFFLGKIKGKDLLKQAMPSLKKARRQLVKDYVVFPLLAGPFFLPVFLGNLAANGIRNVWTYVIIFCGHFTDTVETFPRSVVKNESKAHWYLRQIRGSSNLSGGKLLNVMSGNLSFQIEHHLFPDIPANRYAEMAPVIRDICQRYGQFYSTGSFARQFSTVVWRIVRHAFPSQPTQLAEDLALEQGARR
ncbi:MAG: acyl-CoA desaturase [Aquabacterium sp.]|nr:acyl-CoA desaturase [Aquabacterium sp.]